MTIMQCFMTDIWIKVMSNHELYCTVQVGCREQIRCQFSFEGLSVCSSFSFYWQPIPDVSFSDGEGTFAELQYCLPGNKVIVASRAVCSSARYRHRRFNQVLEVAGCSSIDGLMDKQAKLEFNRLLYWQPLERSEC